MNKIAKLYPVRFEASIGRRYRQVNGFKIVTPDGRELQPYMRKLEARAFCKRQGWEVRVMP